MVRFIPTSDGKSTRLDVELNYRARYGKAGLILAKIFGEEPSQQIDDDLHRCKQLIETGEIATMVGQTCGRRNAT